MDEPSPISRRSHRSNGVVTASFKVTDRHGHRDRVKPLKQQYHGDNYTDTIRTHINSHPSHNARVDREALLDRENVLCIAHQTAPFVYFSSIGSDHARENTFSVRNARETDGSDEALRTVDEASMRQSCGLLSLPEFSFLSDTYSIDQDPCRSIDTVMAAATDHLHTRLLNLQLMEQRQLLESHRLRAQLHSLTIEDRPFTSTMSINHSTNHTLVNSSSQVNSSGRDTPTHSLGPMNKSNRLTERIEDVGFTGIRCPPLDRSSDLVTNIKIDVTFPSPAAASPGQPRSSPFGPSLLSPLTAPRSSLAILTQRSKLRTPHRPLPSVNGPSSTRSERKCSVTSVRCDDSDEGREKRRGALKDLVALATHRGLIRSFKDIRLISAHRGNPCHTTSPRHLCEEAPHRVQQLHRPINNDLDTSMKIVMDLLIPHNSTELGSDNDREGPFMSLESLTDRNWGRFPPPDEDLLRRATLGRGKFGSVYRAEMRLDDVNLMKNVLDKQKGTLSHADGAMSCMETRPAERAALQAFATSSHNPMIPYTPRANTPSNNKTIYDGDGHNTSNKSPTNYGCAPRRNTIGRQCASRKDKVLPAARTVDVNVYQHHLQLLRDMVDNPFSSQQAALLPLSKVVALKVASFLGNISEFNEGDTPLPPLMCLQEFYREVKALSALVHPNIVRIEGVVFAPLAIVMEIVNGPSLAQALTDHSAGGWQEQLTAPVRQQLLHDVALGLRHMHGMGYLHRDVKSHNIMIHLCSKGRTDDKSVYIAKIVDLGTAIHVNRRVVRDDSMDLDDDDGVSLPIIGRTISSRDLVKGSRSKKIIKEAMSGAPLPAVLGSEDIGLSCGGIDQSQVVGTSGYTAPEVLGGKPFGFPADVFSFGIVAWEMFAMDSTANPLTGADVDIQVAMMEAGVRPTWQSTHLPLQRELISFCWQTCPSLRPQMSEVATAIMASPDSIASHRDKEDTPYFRFRMKH